MSIFVVMTVRVALGLVTLLTTGRMILVTVLVL